MGKRLYVTLAKEEIERQGFRDEGAHKSFILFAEAVEKDLTDIKSELAIAKRVKEG